MTENLHSRRNIVGKDINSHLQRSILRLVALNQKAPINQLELVNDAGHTKRCMMASRSNIVIISKKRSTKT